MNETQPPPTDAAIDTLILEHGVMDQAWPTQRQLHAFARAARAAPQPATADALDAMMLDALKHAQKVLNHHNLPLECGPINEAILAAQREVKP